MNAQSPSQLEENTVSRDPKKVYLKNLVTQESGNDHAVPLQKRSGGMQSPREDLTETTNWMDTSEQTRPDQKPFEMSTLSPLTISPLFFTLPSPQASHISDFTLATVSASRVKNLQDDVICSSPSKGKTVPKQESPSSELDRGKANLSDWLDHYLPRSLRAYSVDTTEKVNVSSDCGQPSSEECPAVSAVAPQVISSSSSPTSTVPSSALANDNQKPSDKEKKGSSSAKRKHGGSPGGNVSSSTAAKRSTTDEPCRVCGDAASGFHCGAFICEACKVSFLHFL